VNVVNVLAWLPGRDTSRVVVIGGHYDSCICSVREAANGLPGSFDPTADAPGADDDGSGSSAVVELARAFAARYPKGLEATVLFALYAAEEQGLLGSTHLAERLHARGYRVVAGMTDDIVGNTVADDGTRDARSVRVFSDEQENGPSQELARLAWAAGALYQPDFEVLPVFRLDRVGRGGDHSPFVRKGDAGLRFTERLENYKRQHLPTDDLAHVDFDYVAKVARLNAAVVGSLAAAPATPDSVVAQRDRASGGQKWRLAWKPVPGAAGYEVVVRRTTAPSWERVIRVAAGATEHVLEEQLDDVWAGVRSVGASGHRSLAAVVPQPAPQRAAAPASR
jgi:Zn-dependent M28 family amino/carboxypeptidase